MSEQEKNQAEAGIATVPGIESRLSELEGQREVLSRRVALLTMMVSFMAGCLLLVHTGLLDSAFPRLKLMGAVAKNFALVDSNRKVRGGIHIHDGDSALALKDAEGHMRVYMRSEDSGSKLQLWRSGSSIGSQLKVNEDESVLWLRGGSGNLSLLLQATDNGGQLMINDSGERPRCWIEFNEGRAALVLAGPGDSSAVVSVSEKYGPRVYMTDNLGKVIWQAP